MDIKNEGESENEKKISSVSVPEGENQGQNEETSIAGSASGATGVVAVDPKVMEEGNGEEPAENAPVTGPFSKRQWILFVLLAAIDLLSSMTVSIQAPFYPEEAELKGATALEYGLVFGIFEFIIFITCPVFGKYMNRIGLKTVFNLSILLNSVAVICFGLLEWVDDHTWFITLSFICRIFEGVGVSGFITATFVIIASEFPNSVATTFASLETMIGIGFTIGPTVGAALYSVGGFPLPFFVLGVLFLLMGLSALLCWPLKIVNEKSSLKEAEAQGYGVWTILKIPAVALAALSIASTAVSLGFVSAVLEPHIRPFGLTTLQTGLVFIVNGGVYAVLAPFWGYLCDNIRRPDYITILGSFFIFVSALLIGPASFLPMETTLWVTIVGLVFQGLGFGCCFVSTFIVGLKDCINHGLPDNLATYAVVAGLFQSMISLGAWVGPSLGGYLFDTVGFREGSWLILAISFISGMAVAIHSCCYSSQKLSNDEGETRPLLRSTSAEGGGGTHSSESQPPKTSSSSYGTTSGFEEFFILN